MNSILPIPPGSVAAQCLCLGLRRAARAVARRYDDALRPLDLNNGQYAMLAMIAGMQPAGIQALADALAMDRTTVTAALKPLQRRGLVTVAVAQDDPRGRAVRLAPDGRRLLARAMPVWQAAQRGLAEQLGETDAARLMRQLVRLA